MSHLKFRIPFFRELTKELISTLVEKLECKEFEQGESRKYHWLHN